MVTTCLQRILEGRDVSGAVTYVKAVITELLMNRIDLSLLVISKVGGEQAHGGRGTTGAHCLELTQHLLTSTC